MRSAPAAPHLPNKKRRICDVLFCYYRVVPRLYELNDDFPWAF